jgi:hypothetical protein
MQEKQWERLDQYITEGKIEGQEDQELAELYGTIDEIRALNPQMPGVGFAARITAYVAENQEIDWQKKLNNKRYWNWLKPMGWMSVAAAAVLLITMGVIPTQPTDQLPPVPQAQMTPSINAPLDVQADTALDVALDTKLDKPETIASTERTVSNKTAVPVQENKEGKQTSEGIGEAPKITVVVPPSQTARAQQSSDANTVVQGRMKAAQALVGDSALQASQKPSFRALGIPERAPVNVKVNEDPPSVTMTYKAGKHEVIVRQWPQDIAEAAKASQQQDQAIRITRDNVTAEISGDAERDILEEFAQALR